VLFAEYFLMQFSIFLNVYITVLLS